MFASSLETDSAVIGVVHLLFSSLRQTRMWRAVLGRMGWVGGFCERHRGDPAALGSGLEQDSQQLELPTRMPLRSITKGVSSEAKGPFLTNVI